MQEPRQEDDVQLQDEDVVEVHEDDGEEFMDEDIEGEFQADEEGYESDGDNAKYDGEIVIGAPMPGEEEAMALEQGYREDNSWGVSCEYYNIGRLGHGGHILVSPRI